MELKTIKIISEIFFYASTSCVAIATFRQAKKTIFLPYKAEILKKQIKYYEEIASFFNVRGSHEIEEHFDMANILKINAHRMHYDYVKNKFPKASISSTQKAQNLRANIVGMLVKEETAQNTLLQPSPGEEDKLTSKKNRKTTSIMLPATVIESKNGFARLEYDDQICSNPDLLKQICQLEGNFSIQMKTNSQFTGWDDYEHSRIEYTKAYKKSYERLAKLAATPFLPKELRGLIYDFLEQMDENLTCIGSTITQAAKKMPKNYPTIEKVNQFDDLWITSIYNSSRNDLDELSAQILRYINKHLVIDDIMK
ncbi:hypothetical protein [Maridesulfovibrio sp.]|uniref:hypothetical protein n=1 Tax=Maridesulfovibrio sp. TaxID=2795000 RepID=UPI0029CA12F5|nr:hypothetical protein [Maridesulfovibrio sp.]